MNTPSANDPSNQAKQQLAAACRALDKATRLRWVMLVGQTLVFAVLGLVLADYWLMLPVPLRAAGALGLLVLLGFGLARLIRFVLRPTRLKQGALAIESQRPELGCEVSTTAEYLAGERKIQHQYEPELAAALEAKTAQTLAGAPLPSGGRLARFALLLGATCLALVILVIVAPGGLTALERTTVPFSNAHYTAVQVKPGDFEVPVGHSAELTNIFSGRLPKDARISWMQNAQQKWNTAALTGGTLGTYLYTLSNLQSDVVYHVAGNDALSPDYKITTYVPPTVKDFNVHLKYPDYTKLPDGMQKSPNISVLRASTAEFQIQPSVPLKQAKLRFSKSPEVALTANPDGSWSGTFAITNDSDFFIELADLKGHPGVNEQAYHIKALADNPPKVEISEPGKDIRSSSTNKVLVKISVSDDYGVGQIKLVYNKLGGSQQTIEAKRDSAHNGEVIANAELDLSSMDLKEFELVAYHAEATDNNTLDGPGLGKSPVYFVEITDQQAGNCLCQSQGQKVNLLVIQKQIIADTTAMTPAAAVDKFKEMALRQSDAAEFGRMYQEALSGEDAKAALDEMHAALTEMELAGGELDKQQRAGAIPHEESALAHLYQVVKLMPELGNMPTAPQPPDQKPPPSPKVQVVLDTIKEKKKEQPDNKELQDALDQAKDLARAQSGLNNAMRHPGQSGKAQGQGQAQGQEQQMAQNDSQPPNQSDAQGKGQAQAQAKGKSDSKQPGQKGQQPGQKGQQAGQQQDQNDSENKDSEISNPQPPGSPTEIAEKEDQLSKEAAALGERLARLAGKDKRLGHNAGNGAKKAAAKMAAAGQAMNQGRADAAGEHGFQGELAMRNVIDQLERLLKNQPEPTDIAHEDAPKEYDILISEYLKKLSHAE
ncbi:MAG TPA: DUF4175 family protein [Patescibacteria group bacterium]|nr:DUF4175 family protein [Patescibacteria group bacterium]